MIVVLIGVALGLGASMSLTRFIAAFLWGVTADDVPTFVTIGCLLLATGVVASLIPALRATRVNPLVTLRHE